MRVSPAHAFGNAPLPLASSARVLDGRILKRIEIEAVEAVEQLKGDEEQDEQASRRSSLNACARREELFN
jgi:hypothetical protein